MLSVWYQLGRRCARPLKPVTLKSGMPGLLYLTSPVKPGIPRFAPAVFRPFDCKVVQIVGVEAIRPTRKSLTRFGVRVWV